jgi:5'-nucleotidase (lipoprotein e(P4) family)
MIISGSAIALQLLTGCATPRAPERLVDQNTQGVIWMQNAAEYEALLYQAFNAAKLSVDQAKETQTEPWAVVVDLDETMLDNSPYAAWQLLNGKPYEPATWIEWCKAGETTALPGAVDFAQHVIAQGGALFYISNRQNETYEATFKNLRQIGFPQVNQTTLLLRTDTSNKEVRFKKVTDAGYDIVLMLGDNLNDFPEINTYRQGNAERSAAVETNQSAFGTRFIVFPNPSYGDWEGGLADGYHQLSAEEKLTLRQQKLNAWSGSASDEER